MGKCVLALDCGWVYAFAGFRVMLRKSHQVSCVVPPSLTSQRSPLTSNGQLQKELALRLCVSEGFGPCTCLHMFVATDTHLGHRRQLQGSITAQGLNEETVSCRRLWRADALTPTLHPDRGVNSWHS